MWFLEASSMDFSTSPASLSPRFRGTFREVGSSGCFWNFSLAPTVDILHGHMIQACKDAEFSFDLNNLKAALMAIKNYYKWECITPEVVSTSVMWVAKRHLANLKTLGHCFLKSLDFIKNVAKSQSCPNFLMPNCNIVAGMDVPDSKKIVTDIENVVEEINDDEAQILRYCGYEKKRKNKYSKKYNVD